MPWHEKSAQCIYHKINNMDGNGEEHTEGSSRSMVERMTTELERYRLANPQRQITT